VVTTPTELFPISFEFDEKYDAVNVFVDNTVAEDAGYTVTLVNPVTLKLSPAVPSGIVRVERETDIDKMLYIFDAGALFIEQNVDADFKQLVHSQQEVRDGFIKLRGDVLPLVAGLEEALKQSQEASEAAQEAAEAAEKAAAQTQYYLRYFSTDVTYPKYARIMLDNGEWVKSTIDDNTTNPNTSMTGWELDKPKTRVHYVNEYGDVGNGQDATQAFRAAVADAGVGGRVAFDDGDYLLTLPTNILNGQEVYGTGKTLLINGFDRSVFARGTVAGLIQWGFSLDGLGSQTTIFSIGALAVPTTMFTNTLTLTAAPPSVLKVGSVINLHYFCARVLAINGTVLTLDRTCPYVRAAGSTVYAFNEINTVHVHDFNIDFNGTESNIRWGYGVLGQGGRSNKIENINGQYIGSKMVQLSKDVDSTILNLNGFIGTDNLDTGGHGYVLRLSSGTDSCYVENVVGTKVRHATDISGAHRNRLVNCKGILTEGVAHLTHGNGSYDNKWVDCDSDYCSAAYHSWDGDTFTQFIGGDVKGRLTNTSVNYEPNVVLRGQVVTNPAGYSGAKLDLENLTVTFTAGQSASMFRYSGTGGANVVVKNSKFRIEADAANTCLIYANGTGAVNITFENCIFTVKKIGSIIAMNAASKVTFKNCICVCDDTTSNTPIITSDGIIEVLGGTFSFVSSGVSFFGIPTATSKLIMDGVTFVNASQVWRRTVAGSSITIGRNTLTNSAFATFPNINWASIGVANNAPYPAQGTWANGSRIENPNPVAGSYESYILLNGVWKGVGPIQA